MKKEDCIELKLIASTANLSKYIVFNSTRAILREQLSKGLVKSCTRFMLNTQIIEVHLNEEKIKKEIDYL